MIYVISIISITLLLASFWLFSRSWLLNRSAQINFILFDTTETTIAPEPTFIQSIGKRVRYLLYLLDMSISTIRYNIKKACNKLKKLFGKKPSGRLRPNFEFRSEIWRKKSFFPSFADYLYKLARDDREMARMPHAAGPGYVHPFESVHLIGSMKLPEKVYVNDSCVVELSLLPELRHVGSDSPRLSIAKRENGDVSVIADWNSYQKQLEVKLIGVGVDVTPVEPELQSGSSVFFSWGCAFPRSGLQTLICRVNLSGYNVSASSRLVHLVKVAQIDHLTSHQIRILASIAGILGVISTIFGILKTLGVLIP